MSEIVDKAKALVSTYEQLLEHTRTERDALRAELAAAKEERDRQYEYNAGAIAKFAALELERDRLAAHVERLRAALQPFADRIKLYPPWMWTAMVEREKEGIITGGFRVGGEAVTHMPAMLLVQAEEALAATPAKSLAAHDAAVKVAVLRESIDTFPNIEGGALHERSFAVWVLHMADRIERDGGAKEGA